MVLEGAEALVLPRFGLTCARFQCLPLVTTRVSCNDWSGRTWFGVMAVKTSVPVESD